MKRFSSALFLGLGFALLTVAPAQASSAHDHDHDHGSHGAPAQQSVFVPNQGQWNSRVVFRADVGSGAVFAENDRVTFSVVSTDDLEAAHDLRHSDDWQSLPDFPVRGHGFSLHFVNGQVSAPIGLDEQVLRHNYFLGNDPSRWATSVPTFHGVNMPDIWPGIDVRLSTSNHSPKYDIIVQAGIDASQVVLRYEGLDGIRKVDNALELKTSVGDIIEQAPYAYTVNSYGYHSEVACEFRLVGDEIHFDFPDGYNSTEVLVIDPILLGASYSGMSGASQYGFTSTYGPAGDIFGGGEAFGAGFPTTTGAYSATFGGSVDMAITRFSSDATTAIYATFIGGNNSDLPHSLISDNAGNLYIMGSTGSSNYPTTSGAFDDTFNGGDDIVVSALSPDGTSLFASTYVGGSGGDGNNSDFTLTPNYGDQHRGEVNFDNAGNVIVGSVSTSSNFPTTSGAYSGSLSGFQDAVVFKMAPDLTSMIWGTYLGGTGGDGATALKTDLMGNIVVVGGTNSSNFPTTAGSWATGYGGGSSDGFLARLSPDGSALDASTYVGTNAQDIAYFVEVDEDGNVYAMGNSGSSFPISAGTYANPGSTQFIMRIEPDWSAPTWSTVVGAGTGGSFSPEMAPTAFLVDNCGNVYMGGFTSDNFPVTSDALQPAQAGAGDFHFMVLSPDAATLLYGTYVGGSGWEHVDGGTSRYSKNGVVYQASCTSSADFPITPGAAYPTTGVGWERVVFAIDFEFAGVAASFSSFAGTEAGCAPFTVDFENTSSGADTYDWDFGIPGASSIDFEPSYTFTDTGTYEVVLIASVMDTLSSCEDADTAYLTIIVHDDQIEAAIEFEQDCSINTVDFVNASTPAGTVTWDLGDGSTNTLDSFSHVYVPGASYTVTLTATDSTTCNITDVVDTTLYAYPELIADFDFPDLECAPSDLTAINLTNSTDATYIWAFGNGETSNDFEPTTSYEDGGTYSVMLIAEDPLTCNQTDTIWEDIYLGIPPEANFEVGPGEILPGLPVDFFDLSIDADSWLWDFGDETTSDLQNPQHAFLNPGLYEVCLTATSIDDCEDIFCREINIQQQVYVPNAFTPNGDGLNDMFGPISQFDLSEYSIFIYNRWGELIFSADNPDVRWDGTFQGVDQEMDSYIYFIRADELPNTIKGTVTLMR